jgi:hypothetical protein
MPNWQGWVLGLSWLQGPQSMTDRRLLLGSSLSRLTTCYTRLQPDACATGSLKRPKVSSRI